jgi:hypothetical protein
MRDFFKTLTQSDLAVMLLTLTILALLLTLLSACTTGIKYTYDADGTLLSKAPYFEVGQLQTKDDYSTLDILKGTGFDARIPIPLASTTGIGTLDVALGYFSHVRMIIKPTSTGELPVVVIDSGVNPFNKNGVTDTVLTGKEAVQEFYTEEAVQ